MKGFSFTKTKRINKAFKTRNYTKKKSRILKKSLLNTVRNKKQTTNKNILNLKNFFKQQNSIENKDESFYSKNIVSRKSSFGDQVDLDFEDWKVQVVGNSTPIKKTEKSDKIDLF